MKWNHPYHMVSESPWPILMSMSSWSMVMSVMNNMLMKKTYMLFSIMSTTMVMSMWWRDMNREINQGMHTKKVINGMKMGMMLFITSEVFLFMSLFWTLFHSSTMPSITIGMMWPPLNIQSLNPMNMPLMNTILLLSSGMTLTWSHYSMKNNMKYESSKSMMMTMMMGLTFSIIQMIEYKSSTFTMSDSIYGSIFFMMTGFHGMHVMIGLMMLITSHLRMLNNNMNKKKHLMFELSAWYWHFVDIIWILLFINLYF